MDNTLLISVIVPVFNIANELGRCIESIIGQTYEQLELLLVDDGSTDGSGDLCDAYAVRDARIRVLHQANAGVSAARNTGLDHARGNYIAFLDGDDYVPHFYLERLVQGMDGSALAISSHVRTSDGGYSFEDTREPFITLPVVACAERLLAGRFVVCVCGGLLKKSVLGDLRFEVGLRNNEDKLFLYQYLLRCLDEQLSFSNQRMYAYYVRPNSATGKPWNGNMDLVRAADKMSGITRAVKPEWNDLAIANAIAARFSTMKWILTTANVSDQDSIAALSSLRLEVLGMSTYRATSLRQQVELAALRLGPWAYKLLTVAYYKLVSTEARDRHNEAMTRVLGGSRN